MMRRRRTAPIFAQRRRSRLRRVVGWIPVVAVVAIASGIIILRALDGGPQAVDPGPVHVHALGLNPANGSLYIATHTGLYRLPRDADRAVRVGDRRQDTMGFTVTGPDRFLGSGHPDLRDDLPPLLGLIESRDAGKTWTPVSLLGQVDFHALRVNSRHVVGYDATAGRVMTSGDGGRTWSSRRPPELQLIDLAVDPASTRTLLAAGVYQLFLSQDSGRTWTPRAQATGLLAWPRNDRLYLADPRGRIWLSSDGGRRWQARGLLSGAPAAFLAVGSDELYAATHEGEIQQSGDAGSTWSTRSRP